jgi:aminodeoxyfutalosine synthase
MITDVADSNSVTVQPVKGPNRSRVPVGRVTDEEALSLFRSENLASLAELATRQRIARHGDRAFYILNRHINYSNICVLDCAFCAFGKRKRDADAYELSIDEIAARSDAAHRAGASEIHMVGGLHPTWKFSVYLEILGAIRQAAPAVTIKAFTAVEIMHLAWISKKRMPEVLSELKEAGLDCLTGGGAEIFDQAVRDQICRGKETGTEWLQVHRTAHQLGIRSTATMLFGHIESDEQRVAHLRQLRDLQDETGGFLAFLPLPFKPAYKLAHLPGPTANETLRVIAVSRAYLDNFDHIKAYWISFGLDLAREALNFGADDLDGTIEEERIYHMAGAESPVRQTVDSLRKAIEMAGLRPVLRDAFYNVLSSETAAR